MQRQQTQRGTAEGRRELMRALFLLVACVGSLAPWLVAGDCRMKTGAAHSKCGLPYELSNFQGNFECNKDVVVGRPKSRQELAAVVVGLAGVKGVGVGHSWWAQQFCSGTHSDAINIVMTELEDTVHMYDRDWKSKAQKVIQVDEGKQTVTFPAGTSQRILLDYLAGHRTSTAVMGYSLPAFSWFIDQTVGGACATASHGSSLQYGTLSQQATALKLMLANGTVLDLSSETTPHLFNAARAHVGRLGLTLELSMKIVPQQLVLRRRSDVTFEDFVRQMQELQQQYNAAKEAEDGGSQGAVWKVLKQWDEVEYFWFLPTRNMWRLDFERREPTNDAYQQLEKNQSMVQELSESPLPPGAFHQRQEGTNTRNAIGIDTNPLYWSQTFSRSLAINAMPGVLDNRRAYASMDEYENRMSAAFTNYDQYEMAVPLSAVGDCMEKLRQEISSKALWRGFRTPALVRFVSEDEGYLSPTQGGPRMFVNMEDYVSHATGQRNDDFQEVMGIFRDHCKARMHWGKAGWPEHAACFDGASEYPSTWCHFGCAVTELDPHGKFRSVAADGVWVWRATDLGGKDVPMGSCCGPQGFDSERCKCAARPPCKGDNA